jgi:putative peptidoglycan lipid II flippase
MVKKALSLFKTKISNGLSREITGLHEAAYLLAASAFLSQILALFRDRMLAASFGASHNLDLYYSAFRIPDLIFALLGSIVSASVIMPFFMEKNDQGHDHAKGFFDNIFSLYFLMMVLVSLITFILAPYLLRTLFPTFASTPQFTDLITMTRILLFSPFFLGLSNLFSTVSQSYRRFFIYALSPILYNMGIIFGIIFLYPHFGLVGLAWGVAFGAFLHFFAQVPFTVEKGFWPTLRIPFFSSDTSHSFASIRKAIFVSIPRTITVSSAEITELFLISFASFLLPGSVSIFNFAFNLQSVPFAIVGVSYSMATFPTLAKLFGAGNIKQFTEEMITSSSHIIFWSVPISIMFIVLRAQIVRVILGAGKFNWDDTRLTAAALALFTISLLAQNMTTLFVRSYYSRGKTKAPLIMNLSSAGFMVLTAYLLVHIFNHTVLFRYFFESLFKVSDISGTVMLMLPLGYTIGSLINMILHWFAFHFEFKDYSRRVLKTFFQVFSASIIMGFVSYELLNFFDDIFNIQTTSGLFFQGFLSGIIGILIFVLVLKILKNEQLEEVWNTLHQKIWKPSILVGPDATMD